MSEASDTVGKEELKLNREDILLLAHALNSTRLTQYSRSQKERLPTLGRKIADYLAESEPYKCAGKAEPQPKPPMPPKQPKKLIGFALTRAPGSEWQQTRAKLGGPFAEAAANTPLE